MYKKLFKSHYSIDDFATRTRLTFGLDFIRKACLIVGCVLSLREFRNNIRPDFRYIYIVDTMPFVNRSGTRLREILIEEDVVCNFDIS